MVVYSGVEGEGVCSMRWLYMYGGVFRGGRGVCSMRWLNMYGSVFRGGRGGRV